MTTNQDQKRRNYGRRNIITEDSPFNWNGNWNLGYTPSYAVQKFGGMIFTKRDGYPVLELSLHVKLDLARENQLRTFMQVPIEEYRA